MHIRHFSSFLPQRIKRLLMHTLDREWHVRNKTRIGKEIEMSIVALFITLKN